MRRSASSASGLYLRAVRALSGALPRRRNEGDARGLVLHESVKAGPRLVDAGRRTTAAVVAARARRRRAPPASGAAARRRRRRATPATRRPAASGATSARPCGRRLDETKTVFDRFGGVRFAMFRSVGLCCSPLAKTVFDSFGGVGPSVFAMFRGVGPLSTSQRQVRSPLGRGYETSTGGARGDDMASSKVIGRGVDGSLAAPSPPTREPHMSTLDRSRTGVATPPRLGCGLSAGSRRRHGRGMMGERDPSPGLRGCAHCLRPIEKRLTELPRRLRSG